MDRVSQLMSTPVSNSSPPERELSGKLSPTCIFPSFSWDSLEEDGSFECCSKDPLTGSYHACRRSPRLLTNGYYIWTEDSFLCDPDGHITLNPSQTSVMYKENLVRIFRKKKKMRRSLSSFFDLRAPKSWLHGHIFGDVDSPQSEDIWLESIRSLDPYHHNDHRCDLDCSSLSDDWELQKSISDAPEAASSGHILSQPSREISHHSSLQPWIKPSEHFQENLLVHSKAGLMKEVFSQAILLTACLIISACARWFSGGELANVFTFALMITVTYIMKSLFLALASYLKATTCAGFDST